MPNFRSFSANITNFQTLLNIFGVSCDIIIITECWLQHNPNIVQFNNHNSFNTTNPIKQNDGIVVYVYCCLLAVTVREPKVNDASCLLNIATLAIYRPPSFSNLDPFIETLSVVLTSLSRNKTLIVRGDINIDITHNSDGYLSLLATRGLLPARNFPTHDTTCLDLKAIYNILLLTTR